MDYHKLETSDGIEIRTPKSHIYRTCSDCGDDCYPESSVVPDLGARIAFVCPLHGVQSIVDPFDDKR